MKKLFLFSLLLLLALSVFADTYPIGTLGTSSSATYGPISGYYDFGWTKTIITAAEMSTAGYDGVDDIVGLGYYVGNTPSNYQINDVHCFIRHTTLGTYTTTADETGTAMPDSTAFTQVFSGTLSFNGGGWHYFAFNMANFDWDGASNIEVFWKNWDGEYVTGYPTYRYASTSPDYKLVYKQQDNSWPTTSGTRSTSRSNISIVTPQTDPPNPAILGYPTEAGYAFLDATLSWSDGGGMPTSYDVYLDTVNPPVALVADDIITTFYTPTLTPGTTYYWQVIPRNVNGEAAGCPVWTFQTPTSTQLVESFDDASFPPVGWTTPGGAFTRSTSTPYYGAASAYESIAAGPSYLYSPMLEITATSELDWWMRTATSTGIGRVQIVYSTDGATWNNIGDEIAMPTQTTWMNYNVDLSSLAGNNYFIGYKVYSSTTSSSSVYIDHVVGPEPAAIAPGAVTLTTPADLSTGIIEYPSFAWTPGTTGGVPTGYRLYCDTNPAPSTMLADVTSTSYTAVTALAFNTTYYWKVVAYNGTGNAPDSAIFSFTTREDPTISVLPWTEDFGTTGTTFPPTNWSHYSGLLTADPVTLTPVATGGLLWAQEDWLNTTTDPIDYSACINIYSTTRYHWLMTPPIQMPGTGYQLEFDIALTDYASANPPDDPAGLSGIDDKFVVLIGNGSSWTTANVARQWDNAGSPYIYNSVPHTGMHVTLPLDGYTGTYYVAFYGESTVSNADNDFFVDNVMIRQTPAGAPDHVVLNSPADGTTGLDPAAVTLGWTPALTGGTANYFEVYVGENPIDPSIGYYGEYFYETVVPNLDLSAQGDIDLGYSNTWYWAVLPINTSGAPDPNSPDFMVWNFTTAVDPTIVALPHEEYFDGVTAPALPWGWSAVVQASTTAAYVNTYSSTTYAQSAPNSARLYNSSDATADLRLVTPMIDSSIPVNTIKLKFYARSSSAGYPLLIGTASTPDGSGTFTQLQSIDLTTTKTEYTVSFADYTGTDQYICFKHGLGGTSRTLYVDNVQLIELLANDLAATAISNPGIMIAGTAYDYVIDVYNEGTAIQNAYTVNLVSIDTRTILATLNVNTPLDPGATTQHTLTWTPAAGGVYDVYGQVVLAGDGNTANNVTGTIASYVLDATMTVVPVGDDATTTSGYYLPLSMYYKNSVTEELYFTDETHLQSGTINAIVYKNTFLDNLVDKPVKIWLAHTTATDLSGGWLPAVDYTLVFDGTVDFPAGVNYVVIPLDTPFVYTGGTLATRVNRPMDTLDYSSSNKFYYTTNPAHSTRSRYLQSDTVTYDPMAPSATGSTVNYFPNTMFVVQNAVMQTGAVLNGYVYESGTTTPIEGATVTLTDERYSTTTNAEGFYEFTFWEDHTVGAVASKFAYYDHAVTGLALTMGNTVTQNFSLLAMPRVAVTGYVNANDAVFLAGATVSLSGIENHEVLSSAVDGSFLIPGVLGSDAGLTYTVIISKDGYQSYSGVVTVYQNNMDIGTITLIEYLWTPYNLAATNEGANARLLWDPAGEPDYLFFDFEADNGGWVGSGYGDWEYTNAYTTTGYVDSDTYVDTPPTSAHSGAGLWGTKVLSSYSNAAAWSYLRQTVDLSVFANPVLSFWHYMDGYNSWDYGLIKVNGTTVWGSDAAAVFMPWQELTVDLSAYAGVSNAEISFEWYATGTVNYAGWYLDDIYIGPATRSVASLGTRNIERSFQNYSLYRMLAADEAIPANWTLVNSAITDTTYLDTDFASVPTGEYKWGLKANYTGAQQSEAIISNMLLKEGVSIPEGVSATLVGTDVQLNWTAVAGASYYVIYAADDPYGTFSLVGYSATNSYNIAASAARKFYHVTAATGTMPTRATAK